MFFSFIVYCLFTISFLGSVCEDSSDCNPSVESSLDLCCKDVRRARQGVKRMCDKRETPLPCI